MPFRAQENPPVDSRLFMNRENSHRSCASSQSLLRGMDGLCARGITRRGVSRVGFSRNRPLESWTGPICTRGDHYFRNGGKVSWNLIPSGNDALPARRNLLVGA